MNPRIRRLLPDPGDVTALRDAYDVERPTPDGRPWIAVCMVASLDGSVSVEGTSGKLGNANDLEVLLTIRDLADVIVVGAGTARAEGYGPPRRSGQRIGLVTNSGRVDLESDLFRSGAGFLIAPERAPIDDSRVDVLRAGADSVDLREAMQRLSEVTDQPTFVSAEGGPRLNGSLLDAGLIDELVLTISPRMVGGNGPRINVGSAPAMIGYSLAHLLVDDEQFVFSRWVRS